MRMCFPALTMTLNQQDWYYQLPNRSQIWLFGYDSKERVDKILGTEWNTIYLNECSMLEYYLMTILLTRLSRKSEHLVNKMYFDQNPPARSHWTFSVFHKKENPENKTAIPDPDKWDVFRMNPMGNRENLSSDYIATLEALPERQRRRFLMGEYLEDIEGALWNENILDKNRVDKLPDSIVTTAIGVDPAGSSKTESAETGIVAVSKSREGHYYVFLDRTGKYTPNGWATVIAATYYGQRADRVVAERNYGGDMVESTLRTVDKEMNIIQVNATRGKIVRAEPISGLFEQGLVHIVGTLPELEDELVHFTGQPGEKSPNRLDAMVWAITDLMETIKKEFWVSAI